MYILLFLASNIKQARKLYHQRKAKWTSFSANKIIENIQDLEAAFGYLVKDWKNVGNISLRLGEAEM